MVNAQYRLLTEALGITHLVAVTGVRPAAQTHPVRGQLSALHGRDHPRRRRRPCGAKRARTELSLSTLDSCKGWEGGHYSENPQHCATQVMPISAQYFYTPEWWNVYADTPEAYTSGAKPSAPTTSTSRTRATCTTASAPSTADGSVTRRASTMTWARHSARSRRRRCSSTTRRTSFPAEALEAQLKMIPGASAVAIDSIAGHFIAANADPQATRAMEDAIKGFLRDLEAQRTVGK